VAWVRLTCRPICAPKFSPILLASCRFPSARRGSAGQEVFHLGVHVSERNAVVTFQELDAAGREKVALRKPELRERYAEVEEAIVA
jgi:hypothetical protein